MTSQEIEIAITTGGTEYKERASETITQCFYNDPALKFLLSSLPEAEQRAYLGPYIRILFTAAGMNGAVFQEANDWSTAAVWLLPGHRLDGIGTILRSGMIGVILKLGLGCVKKMLFDFQFQADRLKSKAFGGKKGVQYHYLFFIGTLERARGRGLASKLIREYQAVATQDNLPIWLEATTAHSRDIYRKTGFRVVGELVLGKGTHGADGAKKKGGPGVTLWGMIWEPGKKEASEM